MKEFYYSVIQEIERLCVLRDACKTGKSREELERIYKLDLYPVDSGL